MNSASCTSAAVLLLGVALVFAPQRGNAQAGTAQEIQEADTLVRRGDFAKAAQELQVYTTAHPSDAAAIHLLGVAYYRQGQLTQAEAAFAHALTLNPQDKEAVQLRGLALYRLGRPAEAIPLLERVRDWMGAGNSDVEYILGLCYIDLSRYDDARISFARQYGIEGNSAGAYLIAANLLLRARLGPAAAAAGEKAIALDPHLPLAHFLLGEVALFRQDLPRAKSEFEQEKALNPGFARVYDRLGDTLSRQGDYAGARAALNRAIILDPLSTGPYILLGRVMLRTHDAVSAEMYLHHAETMDPNNYTTHALLGEALRALGHSEDAARETRQAEQIQERDQPKLESLH